GRPPGCREGADVGVDVERQKLRFVAHGRGARRDVPHDLGHAIQVESPEYGASKMESTARRVAASDTSLESQLDSLSLEQALIDFEHANARVIDLTPRLLEASDECIECKE